MDTTIINVITPTPEPVEVGVVQLEEKVEGSFNFVIDGGNSVITTGLKGFIEWGFAAQIMGWTIMADVVGSIVVDVWKDSYANFAPTVADSITGSEKPTLSSAQKNQDLSLTSFSTTVLKGDIWAIAFRFNRV
jgi:hypothetical protein